MIFTKENVEVMSEMTVCPRCGELTDSALIKCQNCGVDVALAAALAALALNSPTSPEAPVHITPEVLVPRLGQYLIERGVLTPEGLQQALDRSRELSAQGQPRLVGQVLLELGLVDKDTLDQAVTEQILQLQSALQQANRQLEQRVQERTRELQAALNRLAEINELKSNFISNVSHELRTPLTHIKGYLDLLVDGSLGSLSQEQTNALKVMLRSEERLEGLIEELIEFSMAASQAISLQLEKVDLGKLVCSVIELSSYKAKVRNITLYPVLPASQTQVQADAKKLQWVAIELLDNAIKFTPAGGRVEIGLRRGANLVELYVSDTGIGISSERQLEIFEPFHQLDGSATRRYGGVGLGLALVKKILEAHGTSATVISEAGQGTRMGFSLPILGG